MHGTTYKEELAYPKNGEASILTGSAEPGYLWGKFPPINVNSYFILISIS